MSQQEDQAASLKRKYLKEKNMIQTSLYLDEDVHADLIYCQKVTGYKKSILMRIAIKKLTEEIRAQNPK